MRDWNKVLFLHTGWTAHYDGSEAPEGGHKFLKSRVGFENNNFKPVDGWCFGYAPVSKTKKGDTGPIKVDGRTLNIDKLGAARTDDRVSGILIIWTARRPHESSVIVGYYRNATVFRKIVRIGAEKAHIATARENDCHLIEETNRFFVVPQKAKGFPGQASAWFPGKHFSGFASDFLSNADRYLQSLGL